jgi:putative transposase
LLRRLLKKQGVAPKRIITDKLRSDGAAKRDIMPMVEHRSHKGFNNRTEFSSSASKTRADDAGLPIAGGLQRFISIFSALRNLFVAPHHRRAALATHAHRIRAMAHWKAVTGAVA